MKKMFLAFLLFSNTLLFAQDDVVNINFNGNTYPVKVGDKIELGYGTNPYGSFMYLTRAHDNKIMLEKNQAGKTFEIKKIKAYKIDKQYYIRIKSGYDWAVFKVFIDSGKCQALEVGEIVKINGVSVSKD